MDRRAFLKLFGVGAATAVVAPQLLAPEPHRRIWQVSRNAPVGSRFYGVRDILAESGVTLVGYDYGLEPDRAALVWGRYDDATGRVHYERVDYDEAHHSGARLQAEMDRQARLYQQAMDAFREQVAAYAKHELTFRIPEHRSPWRQPTLEEAAQAAEDIRAAITSAREGGNG